MGGGAERLGFLAGAAADIDLWSSEREETRGAEGETTREPKRRERARGESGGQAEEEMSARVSDWGDTARGRLIYATPPTV